MKNIFVRIGIVALVFSSVFLSSCLNSDVTPTDHNADLQNIIASIDKTKLAADLAIINDSIVNRWHLENVQHDANGIPYTIDSLGTSTVKPTINSAILLKYEGRLLKKGRNGQTFSASSAGIPTYVFGLIAGLQTTLPLLPAGSKATIYIPSGFAYGINELKDNGVVVVPANSNVIFKVQVTNIQ